MQVNSITNQYNHINPVFTAAAIKPINIAFNTMYDSLVCLEYNPNIFKQRMYTNLNGVKRFRTHKSENPIEDLKKAYNLYKEEFSKFDWVISRKDFSNQLKEDKAKLFLLHNKQKEMIGFYAIEKKQNSDKLYVPLAVLDKKYQKTKEGAEFIKGTMDHIDKYAKRNGYGGVALHVDFSRRNVVKLYKHLGFDIEGMDPKYYTNRHAAFYMTKRF